MKNQNPHCCFIIPKYVLEALEKAGHITKADADKQMVAADILREQRNNLSNKLLNKAHLPPAAAGKGDRFVFDSKQGRTMNKNLVRKEAQAPIADQDANDAYDNSGIVRDYYKNKLNRNSIDNHGLDLDLNVHYQKNLNNAFWDGHEMAFGDGDGKIFAHFAKGLDVIGHELTHGVVQYTCNFNQDEFPGTLNEHVADVFGTVIKQDFKKQNAKTADWLIGDAVVLPGFPGKALRSMKAPGTAFTGDTQPDSMAHYKPWGGDPHLNNGIPNKAFYLVAAGDATITGIDTPAAGLLWYGAIQTMTSNSNFKDLYTAVHAVAVTLSGSGKVPKNAPAVVDHAFKTVGII